MSPAPGNSATATSTSPRVTETTSTTISTPTSTGWRGTRRGRARGFVAQRVWTAGAAGSLVATLIAWSTDVEVRYVQVSAMVAVLLGLVAALAVKQERPSAEGDLNPMLPSIRRNA
jgi:hypothetical protein